MLGLLLYENNKISDYFKETRERNLEDMFED